MLKALLHVAQDHLISVAFEQHQTRVHDILARRTPVYEFARVIRKHFLEGLQKRDNRNGALVELADRGQIKQIGIGVLVNNVGLFLRNHAEFALRFGQSRLGVKPFLCPGLVAENFTHFVRAEQKAVNDAVNCVGSLFLSCSCLKKSNENKPQTDYGFACPLRRIFKKELSEIEETRQMI